MKRNDSANFEERRQLLERVAESADLRKRELVKLRGYRRIHLVAAGLLSPVLLVVIALGADGPTPAVLVFVILVNAWLAGRHDSRIDLLLLLDVCERGREVSDV